MLCFACWRVDRPLLLMLSTLFFWLEGGRPCVACIMHRLDRPAHCFASWRADRLCSLCYAQGGPPCTPFCCLGGWPPCAIKGEEIIPCFRRPKWILRKPAGQNRQPCILGKEGVITSECSPMVTGSNTSGMSLVCGNITDITQLSATRWMIRMPGPCCNLILIYWC